MWTERRLLNTPVSLCLAILASFVGLLIVFAYVPKPHWNHAQALAAFCAMSILLIPFRLAIAERVHRPQFALNASLGRVMSFTCFQCAAIAVAAWIEWQLDVMPGPLLIGIMAGTSSLFRNWIKPSSAARS